MRLASFIFFSLSLLRITLRESPFSLEQTRAHSLFYRENTPQNREGIELINNWSLQDDEEERCEAARREEERKRVSSVVQVQVNKEIS